MKNVKSDAVYLFEHYKQSGPDLAEKLFGRLITQNSLKTFEVSALRNEFQKLLLCKESMVK